jgi:hypothetical protein
MQLTDLIFATVSRLWTPPAKVPGRLTMIIPALRDLRDGGQADKVAAQCRECAHLLARHLYVWRKPFPDKATVKQFNKETMSFTGMNLEDFQNFLMTYFTLKTADGREWLADKPVADRILEACTEPDSPLPLASWQIEIDLKRKAARCK